jgi:ParB-like chromosome segregation protein Spo0J
MANKDIFKKQTGNLIDQNKNTDAYVKQHIKIMPELEALIPPLAEDELSLLTTSIAQEGCRESLILWKQDEDNYILIDGHNRHKICQNLGKPFNIKVLENLLDLEAVKDWMILNQLGKRNATEETKSYLRGLQYKREKQTHGGDRKASGQIDYLKTSERLAEQHKVSAKTIQRDAVFVEALDALVGENTDLKWKILHREIQIPKTAMPKLAKSSEQALTSLRQNLVELQNFGKAYDIAFPSDKTNPTEENILITKLQKAVQDKQKESALEALAMLQDLIKNW